MVSQFITKVGMLMQEIAGVGPEGAGAGLQVVKMKTHSKDKFTHQGWVLLDGDTPTQIVIFIFTVPPPIFVQFNHCIHPYLLLV